MSDTPDWSETQAKLLRDIDAFARKKLDLSAVDAVAEKARREAEFPTIDPNAAPRAAASDKPKAVEPEPDRPAPGGSLLDKLKREAMARQMTESQRFTLQTQKKRFISDALEHAFDYFRELTEQLNILKPPIPVEYGLLNLATFDGMSWQEGRADFRLLSQATDDRLLQQVTLRYRLGAGRQIVVERENPAHEAFAKALHDAGIQFQSEELRNARNHVERTVFTFPCEVRAGFGFTADYEQGDIRLVLRNVRRFGGAEYRLAFEALDQGTLEEMARLLMGEESRFEKMFRRTA